VATATASVGVKATINRGSDATSPAWGKQHSNSDRDGDNNFEMNDEPVVTLVTVTTAQ